MNIQLGNMTIPISPASFNLGQLSPGSKDCLGGLVIGDSDFWILGDVFLQNVYTRPSSPLLLLCLMFAAEFDIGNKRVGFAALK